MIARFYKDSIIIKLTILCFLLSSSFFLFGSEKRTITEARLIENITTPQKPLIDEQYIVFTAQGSSRFTGIAFEHEQYKTIWPFDRIIKRDENGEPIKNLQGKPIESTLFYIAKIPPSTESIRYRMVVDGLWTTDPLNPNTEYDYINSMLVSSLKVKPYEVFETKIDKNDSVLFTCSTEPGKKVFLAGTFNKWDPFMYEMNEIKEGSYELHLPLPPGTWYYAFFVGSEQIPDTINKDRVYTKEGRIASVITIY